MDQLTEKVIAKNVMAVANGPGKKIYPGQLKKALDLLAKGKAVDYEGATGVILLTLEKPKVLS